MFQELLGRQGEEVSFTEPGGLKGKKEPLKQEERDA